jgi:formate hydrogenlyase subunit 6/NADH:ubiquinone oxidoreductase subunit I
VAHVRDKKCPAGVCTSLLDFVITDACVGCGLCKKGCPVSCISGEKKRQHAIDSVRCVKCGTCEGKCPVHAIVRQ